MSTRTWCTWAELSRKARYTAVPHSERGPGNWAAHRAFGLQGKNGQNRQNISHVTLCTCSFPFRFLRFLVFLSSWKQSVKSASLHFASHFVRSLRYHGYCLRFSQVLLYIRALLSGLSLMGRWIHWSFDGLVSAASLLLQQDPSPVRTSRRWIFHHRHLARIQHFSLKTLPLVRTKGLEVIWMIWTRKSFHAMPSGCLHSVTQSLSHFSPSFFGHIAESLCQLHSFSIP